MTNEEKARELQLDCIRNGCGDSTDIRCACEEMAEWKDRQFKEYLEKRLKEYRDSIHTEIDAYDLGYMDVINEIINELFPESEETDNSDRED